MDGRIILAKVLEGANLLDSFGKIRVLQKHTKTLVHLNTPKRRQQNILTRKV
jgi:hypothetical protein